MSFLGGFYLYRVDPNTISIADATTDNAQSANITGVILFKDIGANGESQIIFGYFPIPQSVIQVGGKNPSQLELRNVQSYQRIYKYTEFRYTK